MESINSFIEQNSDQIMGFVTSLAVAILVLIIGLWIIRLVTKGIGRAMTKAKMEVSLQKFLTSLFSMMLKVLLLISVASMVGIETTSFVAILGAAGLAVGFALQGSLSNFAGGVMLMIFKPFKVGDFIETQGHAGKVAEIQIFNTILKTGDNKTIYIPNGAVSSGDIVNYSTEATRRVDMVFGIGYDDDIQKARSVLNRLISADTRILQDPAPQVVIGELADSSVNFTVRVWCQSGDYWGIYFDMHERVKMEFDQESISIPYPQQDLHMHSVS